MKQLTKRFVSIIIGAGLVVGAVFVYATFIRGEYRSAQTVKSDIFGRTSFLERQSGAIEQVEKLIAQYQGEGELQELISKALPLHEDLSGALAQIYGILEQNRLTLQSLTFGVSKASSRASPAGAPATLPIGRAQPTTTLLKPLGVVRVQASFEGTYEDVKRFLESLENNIRIFEVDTLGFAASREEAAGALRHKFSMVAVTYFQDS